MYDDMLCSCKDTKGERQTGESSVLNPSTSNKHLFIIILAVAVIIVIVIVVVTTIAITITILAPPFVLLLPLS